MKSYRKRPAMRQNGGRPGGMEFVKQNNGNVRKLRIIEHEAGEHAFGDDFDARAR